jgi:hypothetical protein
VRGRDIICESRVRENFRSTKSIYKHVIPAQSRNQLVSLFWFNAC